MSPFSSPERHPYRFITAALLVLLSIQGCATPPSASRAGPAAALDGPSARIAPLPQQASRPEPPYLIPVVRYGRYTLVELSPGAGQQDLLEQIVDVTILPTLATTVGEALRYVLLRSGFTLCDSPQIRILNTLPLPAADLHLGPVSLKTALRILVGPAWKLEVNEMTRSVCFLPALPPSGHGSPAVFGPSPPSPPIDAAQPRSGPAEHQP